MQLEFHASGRRDVVGCFDGGRITSDGGGLLLREVDSRIGLLNRMAACFTDYRNPNSIEHTVQSLVAQRIYGLSLGMAEQLRRVGLPGPKAIGIDEISIRKGHTYRIVVSDLIRKRPIWFGGEDRSEVTVR